MAVPIQSAFAATYYVDATAGNDGNDGLTTGTAWKTLSKVSGLTCGTGAGQLAAGDAVLFRGGEVWREQLTVPCSGANGSPITFGSFGTGRPILRGYTAFPGSWTDLGGGLYSQSVPAATGYGFIEDGVMKQSASDSTCANGTWYRGAGPVIYYRPASGTPADHTLYYTSLQTAILAIDKSYITIMDFEVEGYSSQSAPGFSAMYFQGSLAKIDGIVIENIYAHDIANRALAIDNANAPIFRDSEIYRVQTGVYYRSNTTDGLIRGNRVYNVRPYNRGAGDMYAIAVGSSGNNIGNVIEFNEVWDVGDVTVRTSMDAAIAGWNASQQSSGVWRYNYIHDNQTGCINTGNRGGGSVVYGNILVNCGNPSNITGKNSGVYASNASLDPGTVSVYNNTIYNMMGASNQGGIEAYPADSKLLIENNLVSAISSTAAMSIPTQITTSFISNTNIFFNQNATSPLVRYHGADYTTQNFAAYLTASTQDSDSLLVDPNFINTSGTFSTASDFALHSDSAAIDAGTTTEFHTAGSTDYYGNPIYGAPDIGAIEYQPPYTIGTNDLPQTGSVRLYADGKYRELVSPSNGDTADLAVVPESGWQSHDYRQYMDISIDTWTDDGTAWTATSDIATNPVFTVGGLSPDAWYDVAVDGTASAAITGVSCSSSTCQAGGDGTLAFTYTGAWSTHTFRVSAGDDPNPPALPSAPAPVNGATGIAVTQDLAWTAGSGATSHDVYFGTDSSPDESELKGNQVGITYEPGALTAGTTYYWRIDGVNANGTTTGPVWSFTTASAPGGNGGSRRSPKPTKQPAASLSTPGVALPNAISTPAPTSDRASPTPSAAPQATAPRFADTAGHWAEPYITRLANSGAINGKAPGKYDPNGALTRAELAKIVVLAFGLDDGQGEPDLSESSFADVRRDDWYAPYIVIAQQNGLINGLPGGLFRPNTPATRAEALKVLLVAIGAEIHSSPQSFPDVAPDAWYSAIIASATHQGIVGGYTDGTFGPDNSITRAEIAKIIAKLRGMPTH